MHAHQTAESPDNRSRDDHRSHAMGEMNGDVVIRERWNNPAESQWEIRDCESGLRVPHPCAQQELKINSACRQGAHCWKSQALVPVVDSR